MTVFSPTPSPALPCLFPSPLPLLLLPMGKGSHGGVNKI